jgi:hypothetical protein
MGHVSKPGAGEFDVGYAFGHGWYVIDPEGNQVGKYHANRTAALAAKRGAVRKRGFAERHSIRACITCRASFQSEGAHNRMCQGCRTAASSDTAVYGLAPPRRSLRAPR